MSWKVVFEDLVYYRVWLYILRESRSCFCTYRAISKTRIVELGFNLLTSNFFSHYLVRISLKRLPYILISFL